MNGKLNKNIGFSLLPFALIFLFDPFYTLYDFLPDFIGYVIILIAIINLSDISDRMKDAFRGFRKAAIINLLRIPAYFLLKGLFADGEMSLGSLIFTFAFSFAELVAIIPAFKSFFEAMLGLGLTHSGTFVCFEKNRKRTFTEKTYTLTVCFFTVKYLASAVPEFTTLITNDAYTFVFLIRALGILISFILGIIWMIRTRKFCVNVRKDIPFIENLSDSYLKFAHENQGLYVSRNITSALYLMIIAIVLSVNFYVQYVNVLPNAIFYVLILISALMLRKYTDRVTPLFIISPVGIIVSIASSLFAKSFYNDFYPTDVLKSVIAYDRFYTMLGVNAFESVVFLVTVSFTVFMILAICKDHTNIFHTSATKRKAFKSIILIEFFGIIGAASAPYYIASQPFYYLAKWYFEYAAMISVLFTVIFAICAYCYVNIVIGSVKMHYCIRD